MAKLFLLECDLKLGPKHAQALRGIVMAIQQAHVWVSDRDKSNQSRIASKGYWAGRFVHPDFDFLYEVKEVAKLTDPEKIEALLKRIFNDMYELCFPTGKHPKLMNGLFIFILIVVLMASVCSQTWTCGLFTFMAKHVLF